MTTPALSSAALQQTVNAIARVQHADGCIPWTPGGKADPWNMVEAAMALDVGGRHDEAACAYAWLREHRAELRFRTTVRSLAQVGGSWNLRTDGGPLLARDLILAVPPWTARRLLSDATLPERARQCAERLREFEPESIATCYLTWPASQIAALPPWIMLEDHGENGGYGQWLFDRGVQSGLRIAAVVVSARGRHAGVTPEQLETWIAAQVARELGLPAPLAARVIVDKRATFRCVPARPRIEAGCAIPSNASPGSGARVMLAGDHVWPEYPGTLVAAVRSGFAAARSLSA